MAKTRQPPLTKADGETLTKIIAACDETDVYLGKCAASNLDVDAEKRANDSQRETAKAIKAAFFPNMK